MGAQKELKMEKEREPEIKRNKQQIKQHYWYLSGFLEKFEIEIAVNIFS